MPATPNLAIAPLLSCLPLFNNLNAEDIARIARGTREVQAQKGNVLFRKGDACDGFYLVVQGYVKLAFLSRRGDKKAIEIIGSGQSFGEALMLMDKPYTFYGFALCDALLLHIPKSAICEQLDNDPKFGRKMLSGLSAQLHQMVKDVEAYSLHTGKQRVIGYLLRETGASANSGSTSITLSVRKGAIASRLNLTKEHFSRILHDLSDQGLISMRGRNIHIPAMENLRTHVD